MPPSAPSRRRQLALYALIGAFAGGIFGAWSLASQGPDRSVTLSRVAPPAPPACPEGYARAQGFDPSATVEGTRVRWLARCDPRVSQAALSESLELLWSNEVFFDARAQGEALAAFVRAFSRQGHLLLEPPSPAQVVWFGPVPGVALDADGAYRLPALTMRVWVLPAGSNTLQVTLVAPRTRAEAATAAVQGALDRIQGLRAWDPATLASRGWTVRAECPPGYTDATPPGGGTSANAYVGRYCLSPGDDGGVEVTFAEVAARADDAPSVRRLLEAAAAGAQAVGVSTGAGFGPTEPVRVAGLEGATARMEIDPPPARVHVRATLTQGGGGSLYAVGVSMHDHAGTTRTALERWLVATGLPRGYDPRILADRRTARLVGGVLAPAAMTAALAAVVAALFPRKRDGA